MKLYGYWRSSSAWRVRLALHIKQIPFERATVDIVQTTEHEEDAFRAMNPLAQVPVLEIEHAGETMHLSQSVAIIELLDDLFPAPRLYPVDPFRRARVRQLVEMVNAGIQPAQNIYVLNQLKAQGAHTKRSEWARHFIERGLTAMETVATSTAGSFLVGDELTAADVFLVPQLFNARRFGVDLAPFPTLLRVEASCEALPAFEAARPERQPDAPPPGTPAT
jgi:maleylpyruvate isomerase